MFEEHTILLLEKFDHRLLVLIHPAGDGNQEELELSCHGVKNLSKVAAAQSSKQPRLSFLAVQGPWCKLPQGIMVKDSIADITLQQVLTRPEDFDVIATLNLNGDYLSDALAAQVGGIGIAPGGNINYLSGHAIFEATHGTAPKYANQDKVNPGSVVLSAEMMFRYLGWAEAADLILKGLNGAIASKRVTYDFARQMEGAKEIKCSQFGDNIIQNM